MRRWGEVTLGQVADTIAEYRTVALLLVGILILALAVPGAGGGGEEAAGELRDTSQDATTTDAPDALRDGGPSTTEARGGAGTGAAAGGGESTAAGPQEAETAGDGEPPPAQQFAASDPMDAPDCDRDRGRIAIPSYYAPNCVPLWPEDADNGGATYRGMTADTIRVAIYDGETDDQAAAIVADAGADSDERPQEEIDADRDFVYQTLSGIFETYGRTVEWVRLQASGPGDDDTAARADARRAANELEVFASFGGPASTNAYADELAANGVLCFCTVSQPAESYLQWAPHVWTTLMSSTNAYLHRAEHLGKQLWGRPAEHAGDPALQEQERRFGLVYFETDDRAYGAGVDFFEEELARYGAHLDDRIAYAFDLSRAQEMAGAVIQRLQSNGITSVIFAGDPLLPMFFTQEATRQQYFPEWIISGSALTDTAFFARTYDQEQWQNAFGVSFLPARMSPDYQEDLPNLTEWACECEREEYPGGSRTGSLVKLLSGVHLAGPNLTPETFRDGMFAWASTSGRVTRLGTNFGPGNYPWDDYTWFDDTTEIWWDPHAQGEDEIGNPGTGLYRYVDGGKRYLPGQWPEIESRAFDAEGTVFWYDERPPGEEDPMYPSRSSRIE